MRPHNGRLNGWKEIAAHLGVSVRTAQIWENERALPVRRPPGGRGSVFVLLSDLESWESGVEFESPATGQPADRADRPIGVRWTVALAVGLPLVVGWLAYLSKIWVPEPKLLAWWDFESGNGPRIVDRSGNGHDGFINGGGRWVESSIARGSHAFEMDGISGYIEVASTTDLDLGDDPFTISAWVRSNGSGNQEIFHANVLPEGPEFSLRLDGNGLAVMEFRGPRYANRAYTTSLQSLLDGRWHQLTGVRDRDNGNVVLYVDGREASRIADTDGALNLNERGILSIGRRLTTVSSRYFKGSVDQIRIYRGAVSPTEIMNMYMAEKPSPPLSDACVPPPAGIVAWWDGDEASHDTAFDIRGGFDAIFRGPVSITPGKVGQALELRPPGHLMVQGRLPPMETEFTIEGWVLSDGNNHLHQAIINRGYAQESPFDFRVGRVGREQQTDFLRCDIGFAALTFAVSTMEKGWSTADELGACFSKQEWHHFAGTYDGSALRFFFDGSPSGEQSFTGKLIETQVPVTIGWNHFSHEYWTGKIDELTMYDRALTPEELAAIYEAGQLGKCKSGVQTKTAHAAVRIKPAAN